MRIFEWVAVGVIVALCALGVLFVRREFISRGRGTIELCFRLSTMVSGRGWSPGIARFAGDEMRWYRVFSFALRPRRTLSRRGLAVRERREPQPPERLVLPADYVILRCSSQQSHIEIAMAQSTLAGFLSWIEAAPGGAASIRLATH